MEEQINKILKTLKSITPDQGFVERSKNLLMSAQRRDFSLGDLGAGIFESFKWGAALALASALLFIVVGGLSYLQTESIAPAILSNFNDAQLRTEANNLDFQIRLDEISYSLEADKAISAKIDELLNKLAL